MTAPDQMIRGQIPVPWRRSDVVVPNMAAFIFFWNKTAMVWYEEESRKIRQATGLFSRGLSCPVFEPSFPYLNLEKLC
jgi:hypothetical protein